MTGSRIHVPASAASIPDAAAGPCRGVTVRSSMPSKMLSGIPSGILSRIPSRMLVAALATAAVLASFPCRARGDGLRDVHEIHPVDGGRVEFTIVGMEAAEAHADAGARLRPHPE
mgnify:CR=1 FL=1